MSYVIIGKKVNEFKIGDNTISGTDIYLVHSISKSIGDGFMPNFKLNFSKEGKPYVKLEKFVSASVLPYKQIELNKECEIYFDESGKIKSIQY